MGRYSITGLPPPASNYCYPFISLSGGRHFELSVFPKNKTMTPARGFDHGLINPNASTHPPRTWLWYAHHMLCVKTYNEVQHRMKSLINSKLSVSYPCQLHPLQGSILYQCLIFQSDRTGDLISWHGFPSGVDLCCDQLRLAGPG